MSNSSLEERLLNLLTEIDMVIPLENYVLLNKVEGDSENSYAVYAILSHLEDERKFNEILDEGFANIFADWEPKKFNDLEINKYLFNSHKIFQLAIKEETDKGSYIIKRNGSGMSKLLNIPPPPKAPLPELNVMTVSDIKYEYTSEIVFVNTNDGLTDKLNEYGKDGWELVNILDKTSTNINKYLIVFKRRLK